MPMLGQGHQSEINMTPMIDVLLTLVVVFIVLVQIRFVHDVQVPPPTTRPGVTTGKPIVLELKVGGGYAINGEAVSPLRLVERIREIYFGRPDKLLYVRVGSGWNYAGVMDAVDRAKRAGVEEIGYVPPSRQRWSWPSWAAASLPAPLLQTRCNPWEGAHTRPRGSTTRPGPGDRLRAAPRASGCRRCASGRCLPRC